MLRLLVCVVLGVLVGVIPAAPASAANPDRSGQVPSDFDASATSAHFLVHYYTGGESAVSPQAVDQVLQASELAYAKFAEMGFPVPVDDGDGLIDIYYYRLQRDSLHGAAAVDPGKGPTRSGFIRLNTNWALPLETIKHEIFHLVQRAITQWGEGWLAESTASWARWQVDEPPTDNFKYFEDYFVPLDCEEGFEGEATATGPCAEAKGGYRSWLFFSLFEPQFVHTIYDRVQELGKDDRGTHGFDVLLEQLAKRNQTLQGVFEELGTRMVQGTLRYADSQALLPITTNVVAPPASGAASAPTTATVNHASLGFIQLQPAGKECATVPLALERTGSEAAGVRFVQRGGVAQPLAMGTTVVPWIACSDRPADVVVANGTANADTQPFTVTGRVLAPVLSKLSVKGTVTRRAKRAFTVRATVQSTAAGSVSVALKGAKRTLPIKAGANRIALKVPKSFKAKKATLTLTPAIAGYRGATVKKKLRIKSHS